MRMPSSVFMLAVALALAASTAAAAPGARVPAEPAAGPVSGAVAPLGLTALDPALPAGVPVKDAAGDGTFIVVLRDAPLALYRGGVDGLPPTSAAVTGGARLDVDSTNSRAYLSFLDAVQGQFVTTLERELRRPMHVSHRYRHALNGMAVRLSPVEARRAARLPGVISVTPNTPQPLHTDAGPRWIGAGPVWDGSALGAEVGTMGEGVVIGVIDTGINIDHPSFAEVDKHGYEHRNPRQAYLGFCDPTHARYDAKWRCNEKLIGLYSFLEVPANPMNPEDDNGHGSHTAGTAAGNFVTAPYGAPTTTLELEVSGVAPHANIVSYDACYTTSSGQGTCPPAATLAALEQAIVDGVDVLNYSISTSRGSPWADPHLLAFRAIREAGIFAAVSAGNSGPGAGTTAAIAPWVTAVGATTSDRFFASRLSGFSGGDSSPPAEMLGQALAAGYGPAAIVYAGDGTFKTAAGQPDDGACAQAFPAGTFDGQIVVCDRVGNIPRVQRAANARAGGAGGFVLVNTAQQGDALAADPHVLPAVHLSYADGELLKSWLASGRGHRAVIAASTVAYGAAAADQMAGFSSRGPAPSEFCCRRPDLPQPVAQLFSVLKPDVAAPGAEVIAAVASGGNMPAPEFAAYGGTSMSSPHVAGAAALIMSARPEWTVAEVQSALMTTAVTESLRKEDGRTPGNPFDYGAGRVDVSRAVRAGLVLDISTQDFDAADPELGGDPAGLNLPSLIDPRCLDTCSWTRVVVSALDEAVTWSASAAVPGAWPDLTLSVSPETFTLEPGAAQTIRVDADVSDLPRGGWVFAQIALVPDADQAPTAHMPLAVLPVPSILPRVVPVYAVEETGHTVLPGVRAGEVTDLQLNVAGLTRATVTELSLYQDPNPADRFTPTAGKAFLTMTVPAGARRIVAEVFESESHDIDLLLGVDNNRDGLPQANETLCVSFGDSWVEFCEVVAANVPASTFWVVVQNFTASDNAPDLTKIAVAVVPEVDEGNLTATGPAAVPLGRPFDIDLRWSLPGLRSGDRWFGLVEVSSDPLTPGDLGLFLVDVIGREAPPATPTPDRPQPTAAPPDPTAVPSWPFHLFLPKAYSRG